MDFVNALYDVLEAARSTSFSTVEQIMKHSTLGVDKQCVILLAASQENQADVGSNKTQGITQVCNIWVIKRLGNDSLVTVLPGIDTVSNSVIGVLRANPQLITTSYPSGFLLRSRIIAKDPGFATHDSHRWASVHIQLEGVFTRRAS